MTIVKGQKASAIECDIAVIGSGMGGSSVAHRLRYSGLRVVVVERGDRVPREEANWNADEVFGARRYHNAESWIDGHTDKSFSPGVFYYVGGNTKFFGAMLPRFRERDFGEINHFEGVSPAWPFPYSFLEPWYTAAEQVFRVHGSADGDPTEPPRSQPYPFPALLHDSALLRLADSLRKSGLRPFSMPAGVDYGAGGGCILCSTCDGYPCKIDAKCDAEMLALRPALAAGTIEILTNTFIDRLETSVDGRIVVAATGIRKGEPGKIGEPIRIEAKHIVLACGAVNTAALLLKSANSQHPKGVGNGSDLVGRNYMVHNSTFMLAVDPRRRNDVAFQKTLALNDWYLGSDAGGFPLGNVQMLGKIRAPMVRGMHPWLPTAIARYITGHSVDLYLTSEDLPDRENRVTFDRERNTIKVYWRPNNLRAPHELVRVTKKAIRGAGYPFIFTQRMGIATNSHQCGTALMGNDRSSSVVSVAGHLHEVDNVWLADSSPFPSSAAVNPALTIAANAMRVAENLRQAITSKR
jgi:choline dehydrogenase-like flavoprotein